MRDAEATMALKLSNNRVNYCFCGNNTETVLSFIMMTLRYYAKKVFKKPAKFIEAHTAALLRFVRLDTEKEGVRTCSVIN